MQTALIASNEILTRDLNNVYMIESKRNHLLLIMQSMLTANYTRAVPLDGI